MKDDEIKYGTRILNPKEKTIKFPKTSPSKPTKKDSNNNTEGEKQK